MDASIFLAQVIGIFSLAMAAAMALRREMVMEVFRDMAQNRTISYVMGVAITLIGALLLVSHNRWESGFPLVITVIGWLVFVEGMLFLLASQKQLEKYLLLATKKNVYTLIALGYFILGAYLSYIGFLQ